MEAAWSELSGSDFRSFTSGTYTVTLIAPDGTRVRPFEGLSSEQMEALWRVWGEAEPAGWDIRWQGFDC
jgi:hypothetical protein